jgi:hypothetical protein
MRTKKKLLTTHCPTSARPTASLRARPPRRRARAGRDGARAQRVVDSLDGHDAVADLQFGLAHRPKASGAHRSHGRGRPGSLIEMDERARQAERLRAAVKRKDEAAGARAEEESLESRQRPGDEADVRAKSSGHEKKTADK